MNSISVENFNGSSGMNGTTFRLTGVCGHIAGVTCDNCRPRYTSTQCPHCTPRCPHGYPADRVAPFVPQPMVNPAAPLPWTITYKTPNDVTAGVAGYPTTSFSFAGVGNA